MLSFVNVGKENGIIKRVIYGISQNQVQFGNESYCLKEKSVMTDSDEQADGPNQPLKRI